mgnify:CR=1 FL=1
MDTFSAQKRQEIGKLNRENEEKIEKLEHQLETERNKYETYKRENATEKEIQNRESSENKVFLETHFRYKNCVYEDTLHLQIFNIL